MGDDAQLRRSPGVGRDPVPLPARRCAPRAVSPARMANALRSAPVAISFSGRMLRARRLSLPHSRITHLACSRVFLRTPGEPGVPPCTLPGLRRAPAPPLRFGAAPCAFDLAVHASVSVSPTPRGKRAPPRAGPVRARLLCSLCQSALLLPLDYA